MRAQAAHQNATPQLTEARATLGTLPATPIEQPTVNVFTNGRNGRSNLENTTNTAKKPNVREIGYSIEPKKRGTELISEETRSKLNSAELYLLRIIAQQQGGIMPKIAIETVLMAQLGSEISSKIDIDAVITNIQKKAGVRIAFHGIDGSSTPTRSTNKLSDSQPSQNGAEKDETILHHKRFPEALAHIRSHPGISSNELAQIMGTSPAMAMYYLAGLRKSNLVTDQKSPTDGRAKIYFAT